MNRNIYVVDDESNIRELITLYLEKDGFEVTAFSDAESFLKTFQSSPADLVLLDLMLPGMDGKAALRELRKIGDAPVIMVTAKDEQLDKIIGLELGADDYVVKPFDGKELVARVKAVLRRAKGGTGEQVPQGNPNVIEVPNLEINLDNYVVTYKGNTVELPPKEIELLFFLVSNPNRVFTREQLLDKIWGYDYFGETRTVDVHIKRLREKFEDQSNPWELKTVWGVGYKFRLDR